MIVAAACETKAIVTAEDHNKHGGLGGAVAEVLVKRAPVPMEQVALDDIFAESGNGYELLTKFHIDVETIYNRAKQVIERKRVGTPLC